MFEYQDTCEKCSLSHHALTCLLLLIVGLIKDGQSQTCGGTLTDSFGVIISDNFPLPSPKIDKTCTWDISVPEGRVQLWFVEMNFNTEVNVRNENKNTIEVNDGVDNKLLGKCCSTDLNATFTSSGPKMIVKFTTYSTSAHNMAFYAQYASSVVRILAPDIYSVSPGVNRFEITCGANIEHPKKSISLYRLPYLGTSRQYTLIAEAKAHIDGDEVKTFLNDVSVSGDINSSIAVIFPKGTCKDSGIYKCEVIYTINSVESKTETFSTVSASYFARNTTLTVNPSRQCYALKSEVFLTCRASLGSLFVGNLKRVMWKFKYPEHSYWSVESALTTNEVAADPNNDCNWIQVSTLKKTLNDSDNGLTYGCCVDQIFRQNSDYSSGITDYSSFIIPEVRDPTLPKQPNIQVSPEAYSVGSRLTLTCNGSIGVSQNGVKTEWYWQYQDSSSSEWTSYMNSGITNSLPIQDKDNQCDLYQSSSLNINLTTNDNNRKYRCFVGKIFPDGKLKKYEDVNSVFVINFTSQIPHESKSPSTDTGVKKEAIIIITLIVVYFVIAFTAFLFYVHRHLKKTEFYRASSRRNVTTTFEPFANFQTGEIEHMNEYDEENVEPWKFTDESNAQPEGIASTSIEQPERNVDTSI